MFRGLVGVSMVLGGVGCGGHARRGSDEGEAGIEVKAPPVLCENDVAPRSLLPMASDRAGLVHIDVRDSLMVVSFQSLVTAQDGVVHTLDLESGATQRVATGRPDPQWVALGDRAAYWFESTPMPQLVHAALDGSEAPIVVGPAVAGSVVVDDHLYYGRDSSLMAQPLAGGIGVEMARNVSPRELTSDGDYVYFTTCGQGLNRIHKLGGEVEKTASGVCPMALAVAEGQVYFSDFSSESSGFRLFRAQAAGGAEAVAFHDTALQPVTIAADRDSIYVGDIQGLHRIRREVGVPERIATGIPTDIVLDDNCVYWGDSSAHDVFVMRKEPP